MPLDKMILVVMVSTHSHPQLITVKSERSTYQRVCLRPSKVIAPIQRIKPDIQEEARKLPLSNEKAPRAQVIIVRGEDQIDVFGAQMRIRLDDAIGRHDGDILEHHRLQATLVEDMRFYRLARVHEERVGVEVKEKLRVGVGCHRVADGGDERPAARRAFERRFVVGKVREVVGIACARERCGQFCVTELREERGDPGGVAGRLWLLTMALGVIFPVLDDFLDIGIAEERPVEDRDDDDAGGSGGDCRGAGARVEKLREQEEDREEREGQNPNSLELFATLEGESRGSTVRTLEVPPRRHGKLHGESEAKLFRPRQLRF